MERRTGVQGVSSIAQGNGGSSRAASYMLSFLLPTAVLLIVFLGAGIAPFGDSVLLCEANSEWFGALSLLQRSLKSDAGVFYSFAGDLGGDSLALFTSELCSPFWLLTALAKPSQLPAAFALIMILKAGCAGVFADMLLLSICPSKPFAAASFSVAYAAGSSLCLGFLCPQFTDAAVLLPLVGAGAAMLSKQGRLLVLYISCTLFLVSSIRLWPCLAIFLAVFFIWRRIIDGEPEKNPTRLGLLLLSCAFATGSAMAVIVPAASAAELNGGLSQTNFAGLTDIINAMSMGAYPSRGVMPLIFCSAMSLLMLPMYLFYSKLRLAERLTAVLFIAITLVAMAVPPLGRLFMGFGEATGAVVGFGFVYCCSLVAVSARIAESAAEINVGRLLLSWGLTAPVFVAGLLLSEGKADIERVAFTAGFITLYAAMTLIALSGEKGINTLFCSVLMLLICCEAVMGGIYALDSAKPELYSNRQYTQDCTAAEAHGHAVNALEADAQSPFYRVRGVGMPDKNCADTAYLLSIAKTEELLASLGIKNGQGFTRLTDSLFAVKYIAQGEDISINNCALTIGLSVPQTLKDIDQLGENPFEAQNALLSAVAGAERRVFVKPAVNNIYANGGSALQTASGIEFDRSEESASLSLELAAPMNGELFAYFSSSTRGSYLAELNGTQLELQPGVICSLGDYKRGETVSLRLRMTAEGSALERLFFASLDEELTVAAMEQLSLRQLQYVSVSNGVVEASAIVEEGQMLLFSIPYQKGWRAFSNGVELKTRSAVGGLLAVELEPGEHVISLRYRTEHAVPAFVLSALFLIIGLSFALMADKLGLKHARKANNKRFLKAQPKAMLANADFEREDAAPLSEQAGESTRGCYEPSLLMQPIEFHNTVCSPDMPDTGIYEFVRSREYNGFEPEPLSTQAQRQSEGGDEQ